MKIYNFKNIDDNKIVFIGDIHGEFSCLQYTITKGCDIYTDSLIILLGDCGLGFNKLAYYNDVFNKLNDKLVKLNSSILMLRGNHDDPKYFNEEMINFSNIKSIPDYSVIECMKSTILCVGGGLSVDRIWRKQYDEKRNLFVKGKENFKISYWENELPVFNEDLLKELKDNKIKITTVATHTAPSFFPLSNDYGLESWIKLDNNLKDDLKKERGEMDKLYDYLKNNFHIKYWYYGHFHKAEQGTYENVIYHMMDKADTESFIVMTLEEGKKIPSYNKDDYDDMSGEELDF